jgi:hypothetical protein
MHPDDPGCIPFPVVPQGSSAFLCAGHNRTNPVDSASQRPNKGQRLPVGTLADWASKGTGPPYATFGKHVRYRLADLIAWESTQFDLKAVT